jgi:hypothetical protein
VVGGTTCVGGGALVGGGGALVGGTGVGGAAHATRKANAISSTRTLNLLFMLLLLERDVADVHFRGY